MVKFCKFKIFLRYRRSVILPKWLGGIFYKSFRYYFKRNSCSFKKMNCFSCKIQENCLYYQTFEKFSVDMGTGSSFRPFYLIFPFFQRPCVIHPNEVIQMDLITLIPATEVVPRVVLTLDEMGINGFPRRRDNKRNEFELVEIRDFQSSNLIFDGEGFYYKDIVMCDTDDLKINLSPNFRLIFNTPYISEEVPVSLEILLKNIRNRLKYLEGENGKFKNDLELKVKTEIKGYDVCLHGLHYRERESDFYFKGFTGWIDYRCSNLDSISQKLLGIGALLGGGVNASLGCGYFRIE